MAVRVRYAPSPTGLQHIGGVRTALFNYLFARSHKDNEENAFIVRVEDTDASRSKDEYVQDLLETLSWLGITADEYGDVGRFAPYVQSKRSHLYKEYAQQLLDEGHAYYCFTSDKNTDNVETSQEQFGKYNRSSRNLSPAEQEKYRNEGITPVVRLKLPLEGRSVFVDKLLGKIEREYNEVIVDPIILKSDGLPTYHLANVIDDHLMQITHVMRSQEWIPTTPVHVYLYEVFGWKKPEFCHLPMVLGTDGQKLSKRNGSTSVLELRKQGILPEALINCIAMLGWALDGESEFFSLQELEICFSRGNINKAPAQFSQEKLLWYNAHYIRKLDNKQLVSTLLPFLSTEVKQSLSEDTLLELMPLIKDRLETLSDAQPLLLPLCIAPRNFNMQDFLIKNLEEKESYQKSKEGLECIKNIVEEHWEKTSEEFDEKIREAAKQGELKLGQVLMPFRIALVGSKISPSIVPFAKFLEKAEVIARINFAIQTLEKNI